MLLSTVRALALVLALELQVVLELVLVHHLAAPLNGCCSAEEQTQPAAPPSPSLCPVLLSMPLRRLDARTSARCWWQARAAKGSERGRLWVLEPAALNLWVLSLHQHTGV
jgi:hypothetical protein